MEKLHLEKEQNPDLREVLEHEEKQQQRHRRNGVLGTLLALALVAGITWFTYPIWKEHVALPQQLSGTREVLDGVGQRVAAAEDRLQGWADDRDILRAQISDLEKRFRSSLSSARKQTADVASSVGQQLQVELEKGIEPLRTRMAGLETAQEAERARIARIQGEVANLRRDVTQQIAELREGTSRDVLEVNKRIDGSQGELSRLARLHDRERVTFEVNKSRPSEVSPGISLTINKTDVARQTVDGWVHLVPDARTLWVSNQKIQQPMVFYTQQDSRSYELVIMRVAEGSAVGYLMVPRIGGAAPFGPGDK